MVSPTFLDLVAKAQPCSDQAAHATPWLDLQLGPQLRPRGLPQRGPFGLLRLLSDDIMHDGPLHGPSVYVIRVVIESHEPDRPLRSIHALLCRRIGWRSRCGHYHTIGCDQDTTANTGKRDRCRAKKRIWAYQRGEDNTPKRWIWRLLPRFKATNYHDDAQHCHLLASVHFPSF
jgi:hypothetical protein